MTHSILNRSDARTIDVGLSKNGTQYWGLGIEAFMVAIRGFKGWLWCSNNQIICSLIMSSIRWSLKVKLWTSQIGFISYLMIILPIVVPMLNPWKNIIFSHMHTLLFALMKTTQKHSLPLSSKQPTLLEQYSPLSFSNIQHHTNVLFSETPDFFFKAPTFH